MQHCLAFNSGGQRAGCGTVTLSRAASPPPRRNLPPSIDSRNPSGTVALTVGGDPVPVILTVNDPDHAAAELTYEFSDTSPNLDVSHEGGGTFLFTPLAEGTGSIFFASPTLWGPMTR